MDQLQRDELIVLALDGAAEVEAGVSLVDDFEVSPLQEAAHLGLAGQNHLHELPHHLLPLLVGRGQVPLLQAQLSLPAEQQHEPHHPAASGSARPSSAPCFAAFPFPRPFFLSTLPAPASGERGSGGHEWSGQRRKQGPAAGGDSAGRGEETPRHPFWPSPLPPRPCAHSLAGELLSDEESEGGPG